MHDIRITKADLAVEPHQEAVVAMIGAYAQDPMGDGKALADEVTAKLIDGLRAHPTTLIFLAWRYDEPVGIVVCFRGFSTFAARPLINIHDIYVAPELRGRGVGRLLMEAVEQEARATDCCKLTLEVQELNKRAYDAYHSFGFARSIYAREAGGALFLTKVLA